MAEVDTSTRDPGHGSSNPESESESDSQRSANNANSNNPTNATNTNADSSSGSGAGSGIGMVTMRFLVPPAVRRAAAGVAYSSYLVYSKSANDPHYHFADFSLADTSVADIFEYLAKRDIVPRGLLSKVELLVETYTGGPLVSLKRDSGTPLRNLAICDGGLCSVTVHLAPSKSKGTVPRAISSELQPPKSSSRSRVQPGNVFVGTQNHSHSGVTTGSARQTNVKANATAPSAAAFAAAAAAIPRSGGTRSSRLQVRTDNRNANANTNANRNENRGTGSSPRKNNNGLAANLMLSSADEEELAEALGLPSPSGKHRRLRARSPTEQHRQDITVSQ